MFTFIENYKLLFEKSIFTSFGSAAERVESNNDGKITKEDIMRASQRDKMAFKREVGRAKYNAILFEGDSYTLDRLNASQEKVITATADAEQAHKVDVNINNTEVRKTRIREVQKIIGVKPNGIVDGKTEAAVLAFLSSANVSQLKQLQRAIGTPADGDFKKESQAALDRVLNGVSGSPASISDGTVNVVKRSPFEKFFGIGKREELRAEIDRYIGAGSTPELKPLGRAAGKAKKGSATEVNRVYNQVMNEVGNPKYGIPQNVINSFNINFWEGITPKNKKIAQSEVLDAFENALMGNAITEKVAKGELGAQDYLINNDRAVNEQLKLIDGLSFKGAAKRKIDSLQKHIKGNLPSKAMGKNIMFTSRTQGGEYDFSAFTTSLEATEVNGQYFWKMPATQEDIFALVDQMSDAQLKIAAKGYKGKMSKELLKDWIKSGVRKYEVKMFFAESCSNVSFVLSSVGVPQQNFFDPGGSESTGGGGSTGGSSNEGGLSSTPGEEDSGKTDGKGESQGPGDSTDSSVDGGFSQ